MELLIPSNIMDSGSRVFKAKGIKKIKAPNKENYRIDSYVPYGDLVPCTDFLNEPGNNLSEIISCFKVSDYTIESIIKNLGIWSVDNLIDLNDILKQRQSANDILKRKILKTILPYSIDGKVDLHDIYMGGISQDTTTIDFDSQPIQKIGLHFDTWDQLPYKELHNSKNRICINIGEGHRYFIFIATSVFKMKDKLIEINSIYKSLQDSNEIGSLYLQHFEKEDTPVYFIRLEPFEGYIAPTETILHDGSNFDSKHMDFQITARGYFNPKLVIEDVI